MFKKLLNWLLKKLSPRKKQRASELVKKTKSGATEKKTTKKRRTKKMADEVKEQKVETEEKVETKEDTSAEKDNATKPVVEEKETEKTDKKEVKKEDETETADEVKPTEQVAETEPAGNGVRIEDLVTKSMLTEMFAALEAKIDAVVKENGDLKNAVANKDDELNGMRDRYETPDFGNAQKKGVVTKDKSANDSFDEYSKQFM